MNTERDLNLNRINQPSENLQPPAHDDELSLRPYFQTLWRYRRVILLNLAGVAVAFVIGAIITSLSVPAERLSSIQFRLLFDGAAENKYPNQTAFSPTEIVAAPVLTEVYASNNLKRFGAFEDFKEAIFILASNPAIELLTYEYQGKLTDTKLTPVDRARIEEEFRRKREALTDPVFSINLRRHERMTTLPVEVAQKILNDTLATWARQADERKGATRYNVPVLSANILQRDAIEREDYLVGIDILRTKANRVIETIDTLATLPGADVLRIGAEKISLAEVRTNLEDMVRFKVEPLLNLVRSEGVTKNARELSLYANNQLFRLRLDRERSQGLVRTLQDALSMYAAPRLGRSTPTALSNEGATTSGGTAVQLDQTFLDRLMNLSTAEADQKYREDLTTRIIEESERSSTIARETTFYEDLVANLRDTGARPVGDPQTVALVKARTAEAFTDLSKTVEQIAALYQELSARNLNPSTTLYTVTAPFVQRTVRSLTLRTLGLYFGLVMMLAAIIVPAGCLLYDHFRQRQPSVEPSERAQVV